MQRLRAAKNSGESLQRNANDVHLGLLCGQGAAGGLCVETQLHTAFVFGVEALLHQARPKTPSGSELSDLF